MTVSCKSWRNDNSIWLTCYFHILLYFCSRVSNQECPTLGTRVSKWTSWAESSSLATKVVSARFHKIHCAQDSAQDFAQVNYTYLSATWWIHISTMMLNSVSSSTQHAGCKYDVKAMPTLQSHEKHFSPSANQQSSFAEPVKSRQSQQKSTIQLCRATKVMTDPAEIDNFASQGH